MTINNKTYDEDSFNWIIELQQEHRWLLSEKKNAALIELSTTFDHNDERELLRFLLNNFVYLTSDKEEECLESIVEKIISWDVEHNNTLIAAVADKGEVDGSSGGVNNLKHLFPTNSEEWYSRCRPTIHDAIDDVKNNDTVILFDDFVGTGSKIITKVKFFEEKIQEKGISGITIKFICYAAMGEGMSKIKGEGYEIFSPIILEKGISQKFCGQDLDSKIKTMNRMEEKLKKKIKGKRADVKVFSFGYQKSEALYCGANQNCPNNVFPVFWWAELKGGVSRKRLFVRVG